MENNELKLLEIIIDSLNELNKERSKKDTNTPFMLKHFKGVLNERLSYFPDKKAIKKLNEYLFDPRNKEILFNMMNSVSTLQNILKYATDGPNNQKT